MDGWLITYKTSNRKDITLINYYLFGRITTIPGKRKEEKYYYPGLFENTKYRKVANGCYFTQEIIDDYEGRLEIVQANIQFKELQMITSHEYWAAFIKGKGWKIKNWKD